MIPGDAPFRLLEGLLLERSGVLLPWDAEADVLRGIGSPLPREPYLVWRDESVFGGLAVNISLHLAVPGPHTFFLDRIWTMVPDSARAVYPLMVSELEARFGPPHASEVDEQLSEPEDYPWVQWRWQDVRLSLGIQERFGESMAFSIRRDRASG